MLWVRFSNQSNSIEHSHIQSVSILFGICLLISKLRRTKEGEGGGGGDGTPSKCPQYKQAGVRLSNVQLSTTVERSILFDCQLFSNRTFDFVRLTKFYCEFDYVRLPNPIERLVFDWVRLPNVRLDTPGQFWVFKITFPSCKYGIIKYNKGSTSLLINKPLNCDLGKVYNSNFNWFYLFCSILAEDSLSVSSFEAIASSLHQRFNKNEHFQIGSAMVRFKCFLYM